MNDWDSKQRRAQDYKQTLRMMESSSGSQSRNGSDSWNHSTRVPVNMDQRSARNRYANPPPRSFFDQEAAEDDGCKLPIIKVNKMDPGNARQARRPRDRTHLHSIEALRNQNDLVLEDSLDDGETLVGEGKLGLLANMSSRPSPMPSTMLRAEERKPQPSANRMRGMSGPILSSLDDRDRRGGRPRSGRPPSRKAATTSSIPAPSSLNEDNILFDDPNISQSMQQKISKDTDYGEAPRTITNSTAEKLQRTSLEDILSAGIRKETSLVEDRTLLPGSRITAEPQRSAPTAHDAKATPLAKSGRRSSPLENPSEDYESYQYNILESSLSSNKAPVRPNSGQEPKREGSRSSYDKAGTSSFNSKTKATVVGDVEFGDVDDLDDELADLDLKPKMTVKEATFKHFDTKPIDIKTAVELKTLVLGASSQTFTQEWRGQGFTFCDEPRLQYGIVQKKGGPCGILAGVQACVLQALLFSDNKAKPTARDLDVTREQRSAALVAALANILWRAGQGQRAVVAIPGMRAHFPSSSKIKADTITEKLMLSTFDNKEDLQVFIRQTISSFEGDGSCGVLLSLYSAILSRTIAGVRSDMDVAETSLIASHGYCTQEMVNLCLCGKAVSNVFNDVVELEGGPDGETTVLRGVPGRSDIGLLSLFEHYKSCQVGTYMKTPLYPIWVVCSESHFSVIFSLRRELLRDWKAERRFDLYYYDGLAKQESEIRLSIDTTNPSFVAPDSDEELVPPLDMCIRTKWPDAEVSWNGTEPLL